MTTRFEISGKQKGTCFLPCGLAMVYWLPWPKATNVSHIWPEDLQMPCLVWRLIGLLCP